MLSTATRTAVPSRRWVMLGVIYLCMLSFAMALQSVPPVLTLIIPEFGLSHAEGGLLMSLFALPGIVISIPAGMLADRYGQKLVGIGALLFLIVGAAIFALGNSFAVLGAGRVISGIGAMTLLVVLPQMIAQWFAGREIGVSMGVFNTAMPLGTVLSLNFLSLLAQNLGWRSSAWLSVGLGALALVVFAAVFAPAPRNDDHAQHSHEGFFSTLRGAGGAIWLVGLAWLMFNASIIAMFTFTPDLLVAAGWSVASAGFIASAIMWPGLVLSPFVGLAIDRTGKKAVIAGVGGIILAATIVWTPSAMSWALGLMLLVGVGQMLVPAPVFALPPDVVKPQRLGVAFGVVNTCLNIGIVVGPSLVGLLKDVSGSYQASYALMSGLAFCITLFMVGLGRVKRK